MLKIGHRGAAGHVAENTLAGIQRAIDWRLDCVELDVVASRDGRLVIFHDRRLERMTEGKGLVADTSFADLRRLTVKGGHQIPTLEEVLDLAAGRIGLMLELKAPGLAHALTQAVARHGFAGRLLYASFFHQDLVAVRRLQPQAETLALIVGDLVQPAAFALEAQATHVGAAFDFLTQAAVDAVHAAGLRVFAFTVNEPADIQAITALGVDGMISDFPDRL
jgi:glycerophosphoryl diester phosphodiesterase